MKTIQDGNIYSVYDDSLIVYDKLPAKTYLVRFAKLKGFYLQAVPEIGISESKVYGEHEGKILKVMRSFKAIDRNLGVILSGDKGIGKSLFAKMLGIACHDNNIPVLVVDQYVPGIASYIDSIKQEVMVIFDEFDKTFKETSDSSPQVEMLSLFDGLSNGKKLYVITCNEISSMNEFLINRPGRFHYHFRFNYPDASSIREYLEDKLNKEYYKEIDSVIRFSASVPLNYDCLRAIAFELNMGTSFEDAIKDLNIVNLNKKPYEFIIHYNDGSVEKICETIDMFSGDNVDIYVRGGEGNYRIVEIEIDLSKIKYDKEGICYVYVPEKSDFTNLESDQDDPDYKAAEQIIATGVSYIEIKPKRGNNIHYIL